MVTRKKIKNNPIKGKSQSDQKKVKTLSYKAMPFQTGIGGNPQFESMALYNQAPCEKVIKGKGDTYIVLGRDRVGTLLQGRGMKGEAKSSAIDIVVGRYSGIVPEVSPKGTPLYLNPNFAKDAARIYISQKTDIDKNFNIAKGKVGNFENRSGIALKADGIRILSREGIKLVTRNDKINSKTLKSLSHGIDLIALNNDSDLQPIPKGDNLRSALDRLSHHVKSLNKLVRNFLVVQMKYNKAVADHTHHSPFWGLDTSTSILLDNVMGPVTQLSLQNFVDEPLQKHFKNVSSFQITYLNKNGKKYINSKFNNTN